MKQRLGVAAALIKDPELMILDEPTNGLDPEGVVEMRALIRRLGSGDRTVILSSHLLNEVEQTCDRVAIIDHGKLARQGTVHELRGEAALVVRAIPADGARRTLEGMVGSTAIAVADSTFRVKVDPDRAAEINTALVSAGIRVSELRPAERTLEDVFLTVTKQKKEEGAAAA
jgi:ABC-2 type transport system ATP-binding protein